LIEDEEAVSTMSAYGRWVYEYVTISVGLHVIA
jgi:hypothetical protein